MGRPLNRDCFETAWSAGCGWWQYVYQPAFEVRQQPCIVYSIYTNQLTKLLTGAGAREADASKNTDICVNNQLCNVLLLVTLIFIA